MEEKQEEVWKSIKGFEGYYEVSNLGRVRSLDRYIIDSRGIKTFKKGKMLSLVEKNGKGDVDGYLYVDLHMNNNKKRSRVNRLVAIAFIPNPKNKPTVDHINGDKQDNRVENLRWATNKEQSNNENTRKNILAANKITVIGAIEASKKKVKCLETGKVYESYKSAADDYSLKSPSNISAVIDNPNRTSGGKHWVSVKD